MNSDLCVGRLHVGNERVSFREPLQTFSTGPAGGLCTCSAVLLRLSFETICLLGDDVALLLLAGVDVAAPILAVFPYISILGLRCHVSYVNALQNECRGEGKKQKNKESHKETKRNFLQSYTQTHTEFLP